ncbi:MAG: SAM-dependent DNA methyltransferase [Candidatus Pacebacteria bacterium]|nr:SAM-dependent DNA methyltransferase [Candidatus Paceibacterota bacterium]
MFEQAFKNIDNILKNDNAGGAMDYIEQTSWIIFLKYLDDLEIEKGKAARLAGKKYDFILEPDYRWSNWACPMNKEEKIDYNKALTGADLNSFVDQKLFPYLRKFSAENPNTIEYKIGEIFSELKNKIKSGYALREILNIVNVLHFQSNEEKHELSHLYESKIAKMGNAGRDGGQYYTPRPLIRAIVELVDPKIGETVYDGACGSAGFLIEAYDHMTEKREKLSSKDWQVLQEKTFYGKEKITLPYIIGVMNMILHGIDAPNIIHTNTLSENITDIQEKDRFDVILANPPFGGGERKEIQQNFPIKSGETAYLFLQHFIKKLRAGGRAGIVIKNTFLSEDKAANLRKELLNSCDLHTVLDLPGGVFQAGVKTVILFFKKGSPTKKIWYYHLNLDRNLGKTNPLSEQDLSEFVELYKTRVDSKNSWTINVSEVDQKTHDLSVKNPNKLDKVAVRSPKEIIKEIASLDKEVIKIMSELSELI